MDLAILGFEVLETLRAEGSTEVYRCTRVSDGQPVVVKCVPALLRTSLSEARLRYEYTIAQAACTAGAQGVLVPLELIANEKCFALVSKDSGGYALSTLASGTHSLSILEILSIAVRTAQCLTEIHRANIVHKDINAQNIVYNRETNRVEIIDFGISAQLPREQPTLDTRGKPQGTLAYMSPEQTGRTSRLLDYRTDFYSFGVTLYTLLTGRLPFLQNTMQDLLHAILTQSPRAPHTINADVGKPLSALVLKLMAKNADDRYQSGHGLVADLKILRTMATEGTWQEFTLGASDFSDSLQIPEKLYGRAQELGELLEAYQRAAHGKSELVTVRGPPGIGKSALVHELRAPLLQTSGFFAEGRCYELHRHVPLAVFRQAIADVLQQILKDGDQTVQAYRRAITASVGHIGQVLVDIVPELEWVIGKQVSVPPLGTRENQNRLHYAMQKLLSALTSVRPWVLFLDDVQWADASSLVLLETLFADAAKLGIGLVICGYRDNEVNKSHSLSHALKNIRRTHPSLTEIVLVPLAVDSVRALLAQTVHRDDAATLELAALVHSKTFGNPFFVGQFLRHLWLHRLLTTDPKRGTWEWNLSHIRAADVTDNVVALMMRDIRDLPPQSQEMLSMAACLGGQFHLKMLASTTGMPAAEVLETLWPALHAGLLVALDADYRYRNSVEDSLLKFSHDRILQAAYALLTPEQQTQKHYQIGKALLSHLDPAQVEEWIFYVIDHVNRGQPLAPASEHLQILELNCVAGMGAKRSASYRSACQYFQQALSLLPKDAWETEYQRTQNIYFELVSCACFAGMPELGQHALDTMLPRLKTAEERGRVYAMRAQALHLTGTAQEVISTCREGLALLGMRFPRNTGTWAVGWLLARVKVALARRSSASLEAAPEIQEGRILVVLDLLSQLTVAAYITDPKLFAASALRFLRVTLAHGNSRFSAVAYAFYAMMAVSVLHDDTTGRAMIELAMRRLRSHPSSACISFILSVKAGFFLHRDETEAHKILDFAIAADRQAEEAGDPSLMVASTLAISLNLLAHADLSMTDERYAASFAFSYGDSSLQSQLGSSGRQAVRALMGRTSKPTSLSDKGYQEDLALERLRVGNAIPWSVHWMWRALVCFVAADDSEAYTSLQTAMRSPVYGLLFGTAAPVQTAVLGTLLIVRLAKKRGHLLLRERWRLRTFFGLLRWHAEHGANNYGGLLHLVRAETAALRGDAAAAMHGYEQASVRADRGLYRSYAGLIHEQAARFYRGQNMHELASRHIERALADYGAWGAAPKVRALQEEFGEAWRTSAPENDMNVTRDLSSMTMTLGATHHEWDTALQAAQALSSEIRLDKLVQQLMSNAITSASAQRGVLLLLQNGTMTVVADEGKQGVKSAGSQLPDRLLQYVSRSKQHVVLGDAQSSEYAGDPYIASAGVRSLLCLPLLHQGKLTGLVYLENNVTTDAFLMRQVRMVEMLASQAAISLENARLYTDLESIVNERTSALTQAQEQLMKLERDNVEVQMAGGFAHEMRNALAGARNLLAVSRGATATGDLPAWELVADAVASIHDLASPLMNEAQNAQLTAHVHHVIEALERFSESVEGTEQSIDRALKITRQILDYAKLGKVVPEEETVSLQAVIEELLRNMEADLKSHHIQVQVLVPADLTVLVKETHLQSVIENLLVNARDALSTNPTEKPRGIFIEAVPHAGGVLVKVRDTGPGVPEHIRSKLFDAFFSTKPSTGTGLGLGVVRKLVELYQGRVSFTSEVGAGTCFEVQLPKGEPFDRLRAIGGG